VLLPLLVSSVSPSIPIDILPGMRVRIRLDQWQSIMLIPLFQAVAAPADPDSSDSIEETVHLQGDRCTCYRYWDVHLGECDNMTSLVEAKCGPHLC
jgi:hypothetical protein